MRITVAIPTHNPHKRRLTRVLEALHGQTLAKPEFCVLLVDNLSKESISLSTTDLNLRVVREARLGLTWARLRAVNESATDLVVFADDDNVLASDYLEHACNIAEANPKLGAFGGKSVPDWEGGITPPPWLSEFARNLALRDLGEEEIIQGLQAEGRYPTAAPIGAGMVLRRAAIESWVSSLGNGVAISDRKGSSLTSGGDNDIIMHCIEAGFEIGYFPQLTLTHIIPHARLTLEYHARLNRGIAKSWVQVLAQHGICPWPPIQLWTVPLRKARAYIRFRAWASPAHYVRWRGACGHFEGLAALKSNEN